MTNDTRFIYGITKEQADSLDSYIINKINTDFGTNYPSWTDGKYTYNEDLDLYAVIIKRADYPYWYSINIAVENWCSDNELIRSECEATYLELKNMHDGWFPDPEDII